MKSAALLVLLLAAGSIPAHASPERDRRDPIPLLGKAPEEAPAPAPAPLPSPSERATQVRFVRPGASAGAGSIGPAAIPVVGLAPEDPGTPPAGVLGRTATALPVRREVRHARRRHRSPPG